VQQLRSTEVPGQATGTIYVSGGCTALPPAKDGYWIMRLEGDPFAGSLQPRWASFIPAPASRAAGFKGESNYKQEQIWDVTNDGRLIAASGCAFDFDWAELQIIGGDGNPTTLPARATK